MKRALPLSLLSAIILIIGCSREDVNRPVPTSVINRLKEITIQDSLVDYTHTVKFYYDASQRVNSMTFDTKTFYPFPQRYLQYFTDSFYYYGTDTMPWKIESTLSIPGEALQHHTSILSYNTQQKKIKDSSILIQNTRSYIYLSIFEQGSNYLIEKGFNDSIVFFEGNMKEAYRKLNVPLFFTLFYDSVDNKINPYQPLNIAEACFKRNLYFSDDWVNNVREGFAGNFNMQSLNTNNMVKWRFINYALGSPYTNYYTSQYTYNTDGYPLTQDLIIREGAENGSIYDRLKYTYLYY